MPLRFRRSMNGRFSGHGSLSEEPENIHEITENPRMWRRFMPDPPEPSQFTIWPSAIPNTPNSKRICYAPEANELISKLKFLKSSLIKSQLFSLYKNGKRRCRQRANIWVANSWSLFKFSYETYSDPLWQYAFSLCSVDKHGQSRGRSFRDENALDILASSTLRQPRSYIQCGFCSSGN